jgi:GNAT superfamily N-acetyltransferase
MTLTLRDWTPDDDPWIVRRHDEVVTPAFGFNAGHTRDVAQIAARFAARRDPARERCWIAEVNGEHAGCVYLVDEGDGWGRLRLLYVEPNARGHGVGARLVETCVAFAREAGYAGVVLWTMSPLVSARRLYEAAGFVLTERRPHTEYEVDAEDETWRLAFG